MSEASQPAAVDSRDRFRGCLVGLAVGECLGSPVEGLSPAIIKRLHDQITEIRGGGFHGRAPGEYGAHTAMALLLAESIAALARFDMDDVVARWIAWSAEASSGVGETTREALERIRNGTPWRDAGRKVAQANAAGNASMSRAVPLGLHFIRDRAALIQHGADVAVATHAHPEAVGATVAVGELVAELADGASVTEAVEVVAGHARAREEPFIAGCIRGSARKETRDLGTSSYSLHTLEAAAWCLASTGSFEDALVTVVNLGGDAAAHGALTGALAGAHHGHAAIPARWTEALRAHDAILRLADDLHHVEYPDR